MEAIVSVGHGLNIKVVAEGVETPAHFELTQKKQCDFVQGYYLSKPVIALDFEKKYLHR